MTLTLTSTPIRSEGSQVKGDRLMRVADDCDTDHVAIVVQRLADPTKDQSAAVWRIGTTVAVLGAPAQNFAQASASWRRF
jgi:hypothetical protein